MNVNKAFALRISELLIDNKMTQYRLAKNVGLTESCLSAIMNEKNKTVSFSTVILIAEGFNMSLIKFLDCPYFDFDKLEIE